MMTLKEAHVFYEKYKPLYEDKKLKSRTDEAYFINHMDEPKQRYVNDDKSYDVLLHCTKNAEYTQLWIKDAIRLFGNPPIVVTT